MLRRSHGALEVSLRCCLERKKPVFLTFVLKADNRPFTNPFFFSFFVMLLKHVFKNDFYILGGV